MKKNLFIPILAGVLTLSILGVAARLLALPAVSKDMRWFLIPWYDFLLDNGAAGLGKNFSNYTPPYLYLLWLTTLTSDLIPKVAAIKSISVLADLVNAFLVFRLVRLQSPCGWKPYLAAALFLILPTPFFNSAVWGQADAIYTAFLLACLYFLMTDRPMWGMIFFGTAFAFKAQSIFLLPFLVILFFQRRIRWGHFLWVPALYLLLSLPAVLLGKSWLEVLTVYGGQASTYRDLSMNAPNLYSFLSPAAYQAGVPFGILAAMAVTAGWMWVNARSPFNPDRRQLLLMALVSVALIPFLLPKMHDRYFYPADILSFLLAVFMPQFWLVAVAYQIISTSAYMVFLFDAPPALIQIGALLNALVIVFLAWKQVKTASVLRPSS